ncbi:MAG: gliding motility protein GldM [Tannerella sp.]|jgi:gliding motility-associated protein GldM|nr:gliding motility protein GldM [Tannerella sp.]
MAGVSSNPNSPRQKMINLMYLVFIAMMALNVSSEVLDGFELVENSLRASTDNSTKRNEQVMTNLNRAYETNAAKAGEWYDKGKDVKKQSDELFDYINELKVRIVQGADGKEGDVNDVKQKDNLEAASRVMLAPVVGEGKKLKERLKVYREEMSDLVGDPAKKAMFESLLSTEVPRKAGIISGSWEATLFENMPVAAAITLLTKMQNDVRYVEGEVLSTLITNVDEGDYRVNKIEALVIPKSQIVTSGTPYQAQLVLAAIDSTRRPEYFLNGRKLDNEWITLSSGVGEHRIVGEIVADGQTYPYSAEYSVTASTATIAPVLMNFLYESIDNDVAISMSGVPSGAVRATLDGHGNIVKRADGNNIWTVSGLDRARSEKINVVVSAVIGGRTISERQEFTVRPLPPPLPFITYKDADGNTRKFTSGAIAKRAIVDATGVQAAVDDGALNVPHKVTGFTMMIIDGMGNSIPEVSNSGEFTQRQKDYIRNLPRGKRFYIGQVKALDPAGKAISIGYSMEIIIN